MRKNMVFLFLPIFLVFSEFCFSQITPPPPDSPVITEVSKDRLAVDDLLVIKGLNFKPQNDSQTFVLFEGSLPILVQPESDSKISVVVPQGAKSGGVKVKTSTLYNGTLYEFESNEIKVLVIWREKDLRPIIEYFNNYFGYGNYNRNFAVAGVMAGGLNDDVFLRVNGGSVGYTIETFVHLKNDGSWDWQFLGNFWPSQYVWVEAIDPISKSPALLLMTANYIKIQAPGFSSASFQKNNWCPSDIYYDSEGNLYVLGNYQGNIYDPNDDICCVWKFERGEQIILNPNNSNSLIPGGISGYLDNFSVGGNGDIAAEMWLGYNYNFLILSNGSAPQIVTPPVSSLYYCDGMWNFAIDCRGTIYATNENYGYDEWSCCAPIIYTIPNNQPIYTIPNDICGDHIPTVDGYGNIYIFGNRRCLYGSPDYPILYRITPDELLEGYYDCFNCCPTQSLRTEVEHCKNGVADVNVCEEGELILKVDKDPEDASDQIFILDKDHLTADILLGQSPEIKAYWKETGNESAMDNITWDVRQRTVQGALPNSLYPDTPAIIFNDNPTLQRQSLRLQSVHTGSLTIQASSQDPNRQGSLEVTINISYATRLGATNNQYDNEINVAANHYGIPPQYIKSQVDHETNHTFDRQTFRYEPMSYDVQRLNIGSGSFDWALYTPYLFGNPNSLLTDEDNQPRTNFRIYSGYDETQTTWPFVGCTNLGLNDAVTIWQIVKSDDGWRDGSYPYNYYNEHYQGSHRGPCNQRKNWLIPYSYFAHDDRFYSGNSAQGLQASQTTNRIEWLYNHPNVNAEIAVASSYGLLQIMYPTAVGEVRWEQSNPERRHPSYLFNVETNLDVGTHLNAINFRNIVNQHNNSPSFPDCLEYVINLEMTFQQYNPRRHYYGLTIVNGALTFKPFSVCN